MLAEDNEEARQFLRQLLSISERLRAIDNDMPVVAISMLLAVAANEGTTQRDIAATLGIPSATSSRTIAHLSSVKRLGREGLNLVAWYDDPNDRRTKRLVLSPKGRAFVKKLLEG
jgi:DNA-binding MarR family transcriptional regulator